MKRCLLTGEKKPRMWRATSRAGLSPSLSLSLERASFLSSVAAVL